MDKDLHLPFAVDEDFENADKMTAKFFCIMGVILNVKSVYTEVAGTLKNILTFTLSISEMKVITLDVESFSSEEEIKYMRLERGDILGTIAFFSPIEILYTATIPVLRFLQQTQPRHFSY